MYRHSNGQRIRAGRFLFLGFVSKDADV